MQSLNFEYLREKRKELADLGGLAESYAYSDPVTSLLKLRLFIENLVGSIYSDLKLPRPYQATLNDLLNEATFKEITSPVILNKIHTIRIQANKAVHSNVGTVSDALSALQNAFDIGRWLYISRYNGTPAACGDYRAPVQRPQTGSLEAEKKKMLLTLAAQEKEIQELLQKLEAERSNVQESTMEPAALQAEIERGSKAASSLHFDEAATRKQLIDALLMEAGWDVDTSGKHNDSVSPEFEVKHQPTDSGLGYADYVLWNDDGKPLAVVEAKKTAVSAERGRMQAKYYADGLEKMFSHRPVIFYTNGFETYLWNDGADEPPRRLFGFYSKDSLQYLTFQRRERVALETIAPNPQIAGRMYQIEAIKRICERFSGKHRKALVIQATGTGKTRVAIALCEALVRAKWAKRILFLCDRKELRKQALNTFKEHLPGEPRTIVSSDTYKDRNKRIYLATYPAMMKCFQSFDVGFFDLIIADESHRSIYNRYRDLFHYFDALEVGLTATPVQFIARNTYKMFGCEDQDPTCYFSFEEAVNHLPPYLVPYEVKPLTTGFIREGIKYSKMNEEQRRQLEDQMETADSIDYEEKDLDRYIYNRDTNRVIIRNLMEEGIKDATGNRLGRTIVFARNHRHAIMLQEAFDELYPQYGGKFCQVIDNYDPRAEQLIDDFKGIGANHDLTIAISVDMLDTGIDVPSVVNLVFAKPVKSYVKFWQMIGRGTRLCENLFGPGIHKDSFRIFDHWENFEFFDQKYKQVEPSKHKSLFQRMFEARIAVVEAAIEKGDITAFDLGISLLAQDIAALPEDSISVKEKLREIKTIDEKALKSFSAAIKNSLKNDIAPLMQWRDSRGHDEAYKFDYQIALLQTALLHKSAVVADLKDSIIEAVSSLPITINQVREKIEIINKVKSGEFWQSPTVIEIENIRHELRGIMKYREKGGGEPLLPTIIDVTENPDDIVRATYIPKLEGLKLVAYRKRAEEVLNGLFDTMPVLQKIKRAESVTESDIESLCSLVLTQHPDVDLHHLESFYPDLTGGLETLIRSLIGLDVAALNGQFEGFVQKHVSLTAKQIKFLDFLKNHIAQNGGILLEDLYETPFTLIDSEGLDGVFPDEALADELVALIHAFTPHTLSKQAKP